MTALVSIGGIHLVNSSGQPTPDGVATAASTTPFAIRRNWRPTTAEPTTIYSSTILYPDISYGPVADPPIPIVIVCTSHETAVARLQQLERALVRANNIMTLLEMQPTGSSNAMQAEILSAFVRPVAEEDSQFEGWEGFVELHAEIVYIRSAFFARPVVQDPTILISGATMTNTGTGANPDIQAFSTGLDGDLANEGQPSYVTIRPSASGSFVTFYVASIYSRTYSTTGSGAKTTLTSASAALNTVTMTAAQQKQGLKARVLFRFTNNTANVRVRVEVRANTGGTVLYAGKWIAPTAGVATLYDMGKVPFDLYRIVHGLTTGSLQLYIGYKSSDGASATATLGYAETLLYWDFCQIDSPTAVSNASGGTGYRLELYSFLYNDVAGANRPMLPLDAPLAVVFDNTTSSPVDVAPVAGRPPRAIEGGSLYLAMMTAGNVHDTTKTATVSLYHSPLWRTLRGAD